MNEASTDLSVEDAEVKNKHKGILSVQLLVKRVLNNLRVLHEITTLTEISHKLHM